VLHVDVLCLVLEVVLPLIQKPTAKNIELRHGSLQEFFEELGADIICFQETKLMADAIPYNLKAVPGYESFWTCSSAKKGYSGVATYVKLSRAAINAYDDGCLSGVLQVAMFHEYKRDIEYSHLS
jgi:exonuclease III